MYIEPREHGLLDTIDARTEEIERVGAPDVTRPFHGIFARMDIYGGRVALREQRVSRRGKEIRMLGNDLIRDVILFMHLDIQPVVLHAEGSFGNRTIAGIGCLEIGDMNSTSDADEGTNERIHILQIQIFSMNREFKRGLLIHVDIVGSLDFSFGSERCFSMVMPNGTGFIGDIGHSSMQGTFETEFAAVDIGGIELDIQLMGDGGDFFDSEGEGYRT